MRRTIPLCVFTFFAASWGLAPSAMALPSYARQTGLPCSGCHTTPPELNAAGRQFKLLAYVDRAENRELITAAANNRHAGLNLLASLPVSAFLETSLTSTQAPQPGTQDGNFEFPQDIALYLAGGWGDHLGSFIQLTYDGQSDHFGIDNTDIRYANKRQVAGKEWVYGLTLNNNPTVEDLWNSTPAWGFPFIANDSAPTPTAAPIINGRLALDVAGLGAYTMWDQHLYVAGTIYRSDHIGTPQPTNGVGAAYNIRGVAPYWRVAWQENGPKDSLEIGVYGIHMKSTPGAITGPEDSYTDFGPDIQYDRTIGRDVLSVRGTYVRENSALVASATAIPPAANPGPHHLNASNANVEYHVGNRYSGAFGWFLIDGTTDMVLYPKNPVTGSANGNPRSAGYIANLSYWPLQNLDLAFQYTGYTRFNGAGINYDLAGRNASDNNTVYLLARFIF
jgi:hypothetical protein